VVPQVDAERLERGDRSAAGRANMLRRRLENWAAQCRPRVLELSAHRIRDSKGRRRGKLFRRKHLLKRGQVRQRVSNNFAQPRSRQRLPHALAELPHWLPLHRWNLAAKMCCRQLVIAQDPRDFLYDIIGNRYIGPPVRNPYNEAVGRDPAAAKAQSLQDSADLTRRQLDPKYPRETLLSECYADVLWLAGCHIDKTLRRSLPANLDH